MAERDIRIEVVGVGNVLNSAEFLSRVSGNLAQRAVDADECAVQRDQRHADRRFVDRETGRSSDSRSCATADSS